MTGIAHDRFLRDGNRGLSLGLTGSQSHAISQDGLLQWSADNGIKYRDSLVSGVAVLGSISPASFPVALDVPFAEFDGATSSTWFQYPLPAEVIYPFSLAAWARRESVGDRPVLALGDDNGGTRQFGFGSDDGVLEVWRRNTTFRSNSYGTQFTSGSWRHFLVTYHSATTIEAFVDGVSLGVKTVYAVNISSVFDVLVIGTNKAQSNTWFWTGGIHDCRLLQHGVGGSVSADDITNKVMKALPHGDEIIWLPMNEGTGNPVDVIGDMSPSKVGSLDIWSQGKTSTLFDYGVQSESKVSAGCDIIRDPFTDPELSHLPLADATFERTDGDGKTDRILTYSTALAGDDLAKANGYTNNP